MGEIETGHKWWVRYVVVPLIVGMAAVVAVFFKPSDTATFRVPSPTSYGSDKQIETTLEGTVEVTASSPEVVTLDELYVVDEHDTSLVKDVRVRKGSEFVVKWDARDSSTGQLHLVLLGDHDHTILDKKVGQMGLQKVSSEYPILFQLIEEYGGKRRLIKALPVQVF